MPGKKGVRNSNRSQVYQALLDELSTGPKTRAYLVRELSKYIPYEKALRRAEYHRIRKWRNENPEAPLSAAPPRIRYGTMEEKILIGQRSMIGQVIQTAIASGRAVVEKSPHPNKDHRGARGNDIVRLRRPGEIVERHQRRLARSTSYKERRRELRKQRKLEREQDAEARHAA